MEFKPIYYQDGSVAITANGPVAVGDDNRFRAVLKAFTKVQRNQIRGMSLNSDGGILLEGEKISNLVRQTEIKVAVFGGDKCASACFLIFAAAKYKAVSPGASIGVHSPSIVGHDDRDPKYAKMRIQFGVATLKDLTGYGVPQAIIYKLLATTPDSMTWLTHADLSSMGVHFLHF